MIFALLALLAQVPAPPAAGGATCTRAATGQDAFCTASDGVRLHYVDWGGDGPAIVLLAGLGNSARIFDDLAPRLAHGHRVIAITRRGYGLSSDAQSGDYGNARLVRDVLDTMDGLGVTRAAFVGHSLAGGELATLGADHPHRVTRLVYLDAAYDRSAVPALMAKMPAIPGPTPGDLASLPTLTAWREGALRIDLPAIGADLADVMTVTPSGVAQRTAPAVAAKILAGDIATPPRYKVIAAPSLAIYGSKDVAEQVPASARASVRTAVRRYSVDVLRPWMLGAKATFLAQQRCGIAYEAPRSGHYLFLERPAWMARVILGYLRSPEPCGFAVAPVASN